MGKYQPFNDLPASQFQALVADIERNGVLLPIWVDEDGKTIDGHQRRRAAAEAGVECPRVVVEGLNEEEKQRLAVTLNLFRRQLSGVERSKALQQLANLGLSTRRMADALGIPKSTVHDALTQLSESGQLERPERVEGADGRSRPATMPRSTSVEERPANVDPETGEIVSPMGDTETAGGGDEDTSGASGRTPDAPAEPASSSPVPPKNPTLTLLADFSRIRAEAAKWPAFDKHEEVIDAMTTEQRADYRTFVKSMFDHANATLDRLDAPARLQAVK